MLRELNDNEMEEASGGFANLAFGYPKLALINLKRFNSG